MIKKKSKKNHLELKPESILDNHSKNVKKIVEYLRKIICQTVPNVKEKALPGWHAIGFRHPEGGHFCAIFPLDDKVKLYFEYGSYLKDPEKILEGETKQTRYITFNVPSDIKEQSLKNMIQKAIIQLMD